MTKGIAYIIFLTEYFETLSQNLVDLDTSLIHLMKLPKYFICREKIAFPNGKIVRKKMCTKIKQSRLIPEKLTRCPHMG